jgi:hypothetical protein
MSTVVELRAGINELWSEFILGHVLTDRAGNQSEDAWQAYLMTDEEHEELVQETDRLKYLRAPAPYGSILAMVHRPDAARGLKKYQYPIIAIEEALYALPPYPPAPIGDLIRKSSESMESLSVMFDRMILLSDMYLQEKMKNDQTTNDDYPSDTEPPSSA